MLFFTFRHADLHFAPGIFPVQRKRDDSITFTINTAIQRIKLTLI
ncbi:Uncharacterised protein [Salmonella enterica subsp. enterica serovar Bovismorbificans]|uniref:Uncharacterized protein n=1 Tax=Salmonella enterica subsp. enterica serovar Bovismorbificans TaxID=58097 RepID=A0A655CW59_SALET|nr:Uncharacterised protein [Salmonella enterica subsp. enterica serovar Bovismorbificans]